MALLTSYAKLRLDMVMELSWPWPRKRISIDSLLRTASMMIRSFFVRGGY
jgi:hypothetical protein